ncbi:hypothetical protein AQJ23_40025 [Streptomyces antibioticus]|nr:hypothetical protein AQJ23_40025 [Streptomyces antibioticus]
MCTFTHDTCLDVSTARDQDGKDHRHEPRGPGRRRHRRTDSVPAAQAILAAPGDAQGECDLVVHASVTEQ